MEKTWRNFVEIGPLWSIYFSRDTEKEYENVQD